MTTSGRCWVARKSGSSSLLRPGAGGDDEGVGASWKCAKLEFYLCGSERITIPADRRILVDICVELLLFVVILLIENQESAICACILLSAEWGENKR